MQKCLKTLKFPKLKIIIKLCGSILQMVHDAGKPLGTASALKLEAPFRVNYLRAKFVLILIQESITGSSFQYGLHGNSLSLSPDIVRQNTLFPNTERYLQSSAVPPLSSFWSHTCRCVHFEMH